jgi:hypothetical protein
MLYIRLLIIAFICFASCNDLYNTDIKGKWQLKTVEMNNQSVPVDTVWYNFQSVGVFGYQYYYSPEDTFYVLAGTRKHNDKLITIELVPTDRLEHTDWSTNNRNFVLERLTSKHLILSSEGKRYTFNKY